MAAGRLQSLAGSRKALFDNPYLLRIAPTTTATGIHHIQTANKATVSIHIHKDSELR